MSELDPKARALLRASQGGDQPSDAQRERVRRKVMTAIAGAGTAASMGQAGARTGAAKVGASASAKLVVSALVAVAATSGVVVWSRASVHEHVPVAEHARGALPAPIAAPSAAPVIPVAVVAAPATAEPAAVSGTAPALRGGASIPRAREMERKGGATGAHAARAPNRVRASVPPATPQAVVAEGVPGVSSADTSAQPPATEPGGDVAPPVSASAEPGPERVTHVPASAPDPLSRELALISQAQAAVRAGEGERALVLLQRHAAQFPAGALMQERFATQALALCALGRMAEGRRAIDQLAHLSANSPLLGSARRSCAGVR